MIQSRKIGDVRVTRVLEYAAPTHDPAFLFPDLSLSLLKANESWMAPNHWVPSMNKLIVTIQLWVVHAGANIIVVDTGVGNHKPRNIARMNQLNGLVLPWLEAAGAPADKVTHVAHTHLHVDHVGWNTVLTKGEWVPTFPNARYLIPRHDFDHYATALVEKGDPLIDKSFDDSVKPIIDAGLAEFIGDHGEVADCLSVEPAPGHSPGQVTFRVRSRGEEGLFTGDVMHSPIQIAQPTLNSTYCIHADTARRTRAALLAREADRGTLIMPEHFGAPNCGYVRRQGDGFRFEPARWD